MEKIDIIRALKNGNVFEFMANNWWEIEKEDLKDIAKELDYAIYEMVSYLDYEEIQNDTVNNLMEVWEEDLANIQTCVTINF